jgi:8-oxo-dGTP diphosphatase
MIRRFGARPRAGHRYVHRRGAYAVILRGESVLLTHQARPFDEWQLPGGGIDPGESPIRALVREVFEETGWRVQPLRRLGAHRRFTFMPDYGFHAEKLCSIYIAQPIRPHGPPCEPGHRAAWVPLATARDLVAADGDRVFLERAARMPR